MPLAVREWAGHAPEGTHVQLFLPSIHPSIHSSTHSSIHLLIHPSIRTLSSLRITHLSPPPTPAPKKHAAAPASLAEERWPWILLAFLLVAPLSFAQRLTALKYTAGLSVGIVLGLALVALLYAGGAWDACGEAGASPADGEGTCRWVRFCAFFFVFMYVCREKLVCVLCSGGRVVNYT